MGAFYTQNHNKNVKHKTSKASTAMGDHVKCILNVFSFKIVPLMRSPGQQQNMSITDVAIASC